MRTEKVTFTNPPEKEERKNAVVNPVAVANLHSPSATAGCSNMVTPVPHYVPHIPLDWMVGTVAVIIAILKDDDGMKHREEFSSSIVQSRIDMNDYLPTSYDSMSSWRTAVGSLAQPARS